MKSDTQTIVQGLSGARISVLETSSGAIVRKTSDSKKGNQRLEIQMQKQRQFVEQLLPCGCPRVLGHGYKNELFYFEMEFIRGTDGHMYLEKCSPFEVRRFGKNLINLLSAIHEKPPIAASSSKSLFESVIVKLLEIQKASPVIPHDILGKLFAATHRLLQTSPITPSLCHGDLTLENVLVDKAGNLFVLDLLNSAFEHSWQDYVKLNQDLEGGWYLRKGRRISPATIRYLHDVLSEFTKGSQPHFEDCSAVLQAVNFARIIPYLTKASDKQFVLDRIIHFTDRASII